MHKGEELSRELEDAIRRYARTGAAAATELLLLAGEQQEAPAASSGCQGFPARALRLADVTGSHQNDHSATGAPLKFGAHTSVP